MTREELIQEIFRKRTYLCVGLDTDPDKIPRHLHSLKNPVVEFNKKIIDATRDSCVAYKINTAFYEARGAKGWEEMHETVSYISSSHLKIADAKRGDIGNTSSQYARAFFETMSFDAITVAPYMGEDSIRPFLEFANKWTIVLGLTSNPGAHDFELQKLIRKADELDEGVHISRSRTEYLYETVLKATASWGTVNNLMFVIGATQPEEFRNIRELCPNHFFLVPGVGFQGGSLKNISENAINLECGLLVNSSRAIIYASEKENFAEEAAMIANEYQKEMSGYLTQIKELPLT
jgi:orotidine-5'-phosphate decarboxylase